MGFALVCPIYTLSLLGIVCPFLLPSMFETFVCASYFSLSSNTNPIYTTSGGMVNIRLGSNEISIEYSLGQGSLPRVLCILSGPTRTPLAFA